MRSGTTSERFDWVDVAKGLCIVLVVMMHATHGVEKVAGAETWLHGFQDWARPFRMPDFFLISGLFLAARIDLPWAGYLDRKVLHFAYFYVLWLTIQFALKAPLMVADQGVAVTLETFAWSLIDPFGTLWFIYALAVFFVVAKLAQPLPRIATFVAAAVLHLLAPKTGWVLLDEFSDRFVFFYTGYLAAPYILAFAELARATGRNALVAVLGGWAVINTLAVASGAAQLPGLDLAVSYIGIAAVIAFSILVAETGAGRMLAYCGRNSISIYLAFTLFMGPARAVLLALAGGYITAVAVVSTAAGVIGPLLLRRVVAGTRLEFLFVRPRALRLAGIGEALASSRLAARDRAIAGPV